MFTIFKLSPIFYKEIYILFTKIIIVKWHCLVAVVSFIFTFFQFLWYSGKKSTKSHTDDCFYQLFFMCCYSKLVTINKVKKYSRVPINRRVWITAGEKNTVSFLLAAGSFNSRYIGFIFLVFFSLPKKTESFILDCFIQFLINLQCKQNKMPTNFFKIHEKTLNSIPLTQYRQIIYGKILWLSQI
jgi:hypothetical protein